MPILTKRTYNELLDEHYRAGYEEGGTRGYDRGLAEGLTADRSGTLVNTAGVFVFNEHAPFTTAELDVMLAALLNDRSAGEDSALLIKIAGMAGAQRTKEVAQ